MKINWKTLAAKALRFATYGVTSGVVSTQALGVHGVSADGLLGLFLGLLAAVDHALIEAPAK
jgi:hypothetical protein